MTDTKMSGIYNFFEKIIIHSFVTEDNNTLNYVYGYPRIVGQRIAVIF